MARAIALPTVGRATIMLICWYASCCVLSRRNKPLCLTLLPKPSTDLCGRCSLDANPAYPPRRYP